MRVDHGGADIGMTEQLLNRANIISVLQKVRRERVAERMTARRLGDARPQTGRMKCLLQYGLMKVMATPDPRL